MIKLVFSNFDFNKPTLGFIKHIAEQKYEAAAGAEFNDLRIWLADRSYHPRTTIPYIFKVDASMTTEHASVRYDDTNVLSISMFAGALTDDGGSENLLGRKVEPLEALKSLEDSVTDFNEKTNRAYLEVVASLRPLFRKVFEKATSVHLDNRGPDPIWNVAFTGNMESVAQLTLYVSDTQPE